jgi:hypothetical protein
MNVSLFRVNSATAFDYAEDKSGTPATNDTIKDYPIDYFYQSLLSDAMKGYYVPRIQILPTSLFDVEVTTVQPIILIVGKPETYDKRATGDWTEGYTLDALQKDQIIEFVEKREHLKSVIQSARNEILHYFPEGKLKINMFQDPEENQMKMELVIHIITSLAPEMALKLLDDFDDNWWLDKSQGIEDELCIHLVTL